MTDALAIAPHGPNALFNQPGVEPRRAKRMRRRHKDALGQLEAYVSGPAYTPDGADQLAYRLKAATGQPGELISPGIRRIRGNLCNVHGRYGPCDKALSGKPKKGRKPRAAAKPKKVPLTPEQRASARDTEHQANVDSVAQRMAETDTGLSPSGVRALTAFAKGEQPDAARADGLIKMGLAEQASDGSYRMTPTGRAAVSAMQAGDYQRTIDAISRGTDATGKRTERQTARTARQQAAAEKRAATQAKRTPRARRAAKKPRAVAPAPSPIPSRASAAPKRTSIPKAGAHVNAPKGAAQPKPVAPPKQPSPALRAQAAKLSDGTASDDDVAALVRNGLAKLGKDGQPVLTAAGVKATQKEMSWTGAHRTIAQWEQSIAQWLPTDSVAPFSVYKDSSGRDRWLSITTSAYEDRDEEIISTKAIAKVVAMGDATGQRGTLRYWHVPGLDIGDCDFQLQAGPGDRFLIEGGTFRSKAYAAFGRALSDAGYQMSPGFLHTPDQPVARVFDDIGIFERSPVPPHRASNYLTQFATKEDRMLTAEKEAEYRARAGNNPEALALLDSLLAKTVTTDKAAQDAGIAYKEAPPWAQALIERIDKLEATTKAAPPFVKEDAATEPEIKADEMPVDETVVEDDPIEDDDSALTLSSGDIAALTQAFANALQQAVSTIMGGMDLEKKVAGHVQTMMAPLQAQKDDAQAKQAAEIEALKAQLKEVARGNLPASLFDPVAAAQMYRPSQALSNLAPADAKTVKEALSTAQARPSSNMTPEEQGAYTLIFGQ